MVYYLRRWTLEDGVDLNPVNPHCLFILLLDQGHPACVDLLFFVWCLVLSWKDTEVLSFCLLHDLSEFGLYPA